MYYTPLPALQHMYYLDKEHNRASRYMVDKLDCAWRMEWRDFLDAMRGHRTQWTFRYPAAGQAQAPGKTVQGKALGRMAMARHWLGIDKHTVPHAAQYGGVSS
jgi:hypothetical protein